MGITVRNININGKLIGKDFIPAPPPAPPVPANFKYNTLLLPGTGTNNATNNTFIDSSSNSLSITRVGNTTQGSFSPFSTAPGYYSNYFDGNGDYLRLSNQAMDLGSQDFTAEMWVYLNALPTSNNWPNDWSNCGVLLTLGTFNLGDGFGFMIGSTEMFVHDNNDTKLGSALHGMTSNRWYHLAYVRNSNVIYFYVDGVQKGSVSFTQTISSGAFTYIGSETGQGAYINGHISNLRLVKGSALYTTNFTPSTTPLTAVSGTSLLTCNNNRYMDSSSNNFAITAFGNTSVSTFGPFDPTSTYNSSTMGGSMYFDGSGDYLTIPNNTALNMESSDFTIECWYYPQTTPTTNGLFSKRANGSSVGGFGIYFYNSLAPYLLATTDGSNWQVNNASSVSCTLNSWNHIAVTRSGDTWKVFVNGTLGLTTTLSGTVPTNTASFAVGAHAADGNSAINSSYISNFRVVKGTAVYTAAFTPPTAPVTAIANTSLLLNGTNAAIYDGAAKNVVGTVGTAKISTSLSASGSMYFDGSGNLSIPNSSEFNFGSGDFTIEMWINISSALSGGKAILSTGWPAINSSILIYSDSSLNRISLYSSSNGGSWNIASQTAIVQTPSINTWYHIAVSREGSTIRTFANGSVVSTISNVSASLYSSSYPLTVASGNSNDYRQECYMQDLRITKGTARYTANFTPPARS